MCFIGLFFENTEIGEYSRKPSETIEDIYKKAIAEKFITEKYQIIQKLRQYGIQVIFNKPEDLSVNTMNKYLELKSRGLI